jgi:cytochrome c
MSRSGLLTLIALLILATARQGAAAGDPEAGAQVFRTCAACHTLEPGEHRTGPSLAGVFGREAGTAEGFHRYSEALRSADLVWSEDTLNGFLADPQAFLPGNRMTFRGINDAQARADLIAYLQAAGARAEAAERGGMMATPQLMDLRREVGPNNRITSIRYCGDTYTVGVESGTPPLLGVQPALQDRFRRQGPRARASGPDPGQHDGRSGVRNLRRARGKSAPSLRSIARRTARVSARRMTPCDGLL